MPNKAVIPFVIGLALYISTPCHAQQLLESYQALLSERDHLNSKGRRLTTAPSIIRQDRANFHRFGIRDPDDESDSYFADSKNRETLERLLNRGQADAATVSRIVNGTPLVLVEVYRGNDGDFVNVTVVTPSPPPQTPPTSSEQPEPQEQYATGTGFTVSNDGFVLTNRHVVEKCGGITIHDRGPATVKEVDQTNDLALLKIQGSTVAATFRSTSPDLGEAVYALGFPYSGVLGPGVNFTGGLISSLSGIGNDSRYLQFTAPVQPGNSGGPLVDVNGLIVGVVSARLADVEMLKASGSLPQNVNFAIRGDLATGFLRANGVAPAVAEPKSPLSTSAIASNAQAYTVQVVCQSAR